MPKILLLSMLALLISCKSSQNRQGASELKAEWYSWSGGQDGVRGRDYVIEIPTEKLQGKEVSKIQIGKKTHKPDEMKEQNALTKIRVHEQFSKPPVSLDNPDPKSDIPPKPDEITILLADGNKIIIKNLIEIESKNYQ